MIHGFKCPRKIFISLLFLWFCGAIRLLRAQNDEALDSDREALRLFLQNALPQPYPFNLSASPCGWPGITCSNNRVQLVDWKNMGLSGPIPQGSFGKLEALVSLNLFNNTISGSVPTDLWDLPLLQSLNLADNLLSGSISFSAQQPKSAASLFFLDLSHNQISGRVPPDIGSFRNLLSLNLSSNLLQDSVPDGIFLCSLLQQLDLSHNALSGSVPPGLAHLSQLRVLALNRNSLAGPVPTEISRLHYLTVLDLSENQFTGPFPRLDGLRKLEFLNISANFLSGSIPVGAFRVPGLKTFSARNNRLVGGLPAPSAKQSNLSFIDLGMNGLSGEVSSGIWNMNSLETLRLDGNKLTGELPSQVGPALKELDLRRNEFTGGIPSDMGVFQALAFVDLSSNRLSGSLPKSLVGFPAMVHLGLDNNPFAESQFPDVQHGLAKLEYLNLSAIHLVGRIPEDIGKLQELKQLDLSHNELNGGLPTSLGDLASLTVLDVSYNNFTGSIPASLGKLKQLRTFNASYNDLSGSVPDAPFIAPEAVLGNRKLCGQPVHVACETSRGDRDGGVETTARRRHKHLRVAVLVGIITGSVAALVCAVAGIFCCSRMHPIYKKKPESPKEERYISMSGPFSGEMDPSVWAAGVREPQTIPVVMFEKPLLNLSFSDILQATENFSKEAQLPDGGCGPLFQGMLPSGMHVAVKIVGEGIPSEDAAAQLVALGKLKHPNVVPLLGYCMVGVERLLIYEYCQDGGDVYSRLHELPEGVRNTEDWSTDTWEHGQEAAATWSGMTWAVRHKVALGTARALAFLHHGCSPPVVHGEVKASNILLDSELEARLAGTGLPQLAEVGCAEPGYVPPESSAATPASPKGDVYAFGVLLLELVTGKRPAGDDYPGNHHIGDLVHWTRSLIKEKRGFKALDLKVARGDEEIAEMLEALRIAYLCTADAPTKRPTMQQVVGLLKDLRPSSSYSGELWNSL